MFLSYLKVWIQGDGIIAALINFMEKRRFKLCRNSRTANLSTWPFTSCCDWFQDPATFPWYKVPEPLRQRRFEELWQLAHRCGYSDAMQAVKLLTEQTTAAAADAPGERQRLNRSQLRALKSGTSAVPVYGKGPRGLPCSTSKTCRSSTEKGKERKTMIDATSDNMCLPALAAKSSPRLDKGKRVYGQNALAASDWPGRRSSLLQNQAYAQQFDSAAGSHTGSHDGPSSVRVYSHNDRDRLYDGLAGRPGLQGPPAPFNTPRRRFPAAGVSQVDGLLRNSKPLTSEHPSEYGELYTGAAGAPKHWLLASNSSASAPPRYRFQPVGAGPSQVDEVVLGHDIDCSTELTQLLLDGAAGIKSIGQTARVEARRHIPGGGDSQVDELIWGSDVDGSADPRIMEAKAQLFQGAA
eukprot:symbB.v1.2.035226.t1/scaffold4694.1/size36271/6